MNVVHASRILLLSFSGEMIEATAGKGSNEARHARVPDYVCHFKKEAWRNKT